MKNIGGTSKYIAFLDECGDHSLLKTDNDFPIFLLALVLVERKEYSEHIIPEISKFKLRYWNHEGVNLHSRDIRKQNGPFVFLTRKDIRDKFIDEMTSLMENSKFTLFISCIHKLKHKDRYGDKAGNPYNIALAFSMERVLHFMEKAGEAELPIIAEARGKKEDEDLERVFYAIMSNGTSYIGAERFKKLNFPLLFKSKQWNIAGIQIADLCAHPCARHILKPDQANKAYDVVSKKIYKNGSVSGMKVFP